MTKKTLIELMLENDVQWTEGAEFAAQDKSNKNVAFCKGNKPSRYNGDDEWHDGIGCYWVGCAIKLPELCRNWHQTVVTREQYEAAQVRRNSSKRAQPMAVEVKFSEEVEKTRTLDAIISDIKESTEKVNHHGAEMQTYDAARTHYINELNEMLAKVGMKVVDAEREVATENGGWPDYCDENGIVVDWDKVPEGSEVRCVSCDGSYYFTEGGVYIVGDDEHGDYGPLDDENNAPSKRAIHLYKFRLIK